MRVRVSTGLDVEGYLGSFYKPPNSPTDIYLPAIDCDKAVLARLTLTEKLTPGSEVYLQSALLYTRCRTHALTSGSLSHFSTIMNSH
jgi:protein transport protein SEC24